MTFIEYLIFPIPLFVAVYVFFAMRKDDITVGEFVAMIIVSCIPLLREVVVFFVVYDYDSQESDFFGQTIVQKAELVI